MGGPPLGCRLKFSYFVGSWLTFSIYVVVGKSQLIAEPPCARAWSSIPKRKWKTVDTRNLVMTSPYVPPYVLAFFPGRGK